jgi:hypothetical protein
MNYIIGFFFVLILMWFLYQSVDVSIKEEQ